MIKLFNGSRVAEPKPTEIVLSTPTPAEEAVQYAALASELGMAIPESVTALADPDLRPAKLLSILKSAGCRIYSLDKVRAYMNAKFGAESSGKQAGWFWQPLRKLDYNLHRRNNSFMQDFAGGSPGWDQIGGITQYPDAIPMPVLMTIKAVITESKAQDVTPYFFVGAKHSGSLVKNLDPFLAVTLDADMAPIVVERWDEPAFRD